ncbi:MAG: PEP-CTERM sorting domain-containing protein, partial [Thermoguttaceae bacterium]|nr:PEP-CTERM sorting domain-containing protein [Thermoguttaceae bacterium]
EPATWVLLVFGTLGILAVKRKKN